MEKDMISIIVPVYNVAQYLDECVKSICQQEYINVEIILVDDGATDGSGEKCDAWKEADERIVVLHKTNGGLSSARNAGLDAAKGEYIAFVDSDDLIEKSIYVRLLDVMQHKKCDIVGCTYRLVDVNGDIIPHDNEGIKEGYLTREQYLKEIFRNGRTRCELAVVWNKLYKRELINQVRFAEGVVHEDEFFLNDTLFRMNSFFFIDEELYLYRKRDNSIMNQLFSEKRVDYYYALRQRLDLCLNSNINQESVTVIADKLIDNGIRFWLMLEYLQLLDKEKRVHFYNDVNNDLEKYSDYIKKKIKILCWFFNHNPIFLARIYRIYRNILKYKD